MRRFIRDNFTEFGLAVGAAVSVLVTTVVCVWEWAENPGGIFRDDQGTNWQFVFDTAWSWWVPTFVYTVVAVSLAHLLWAVAAWVLVQCSILFGT